MEAIYNLFSSIPFALALLGLGFLFFIVQVFFITYHLIRFGIGSKPKIIALIFFSGSWLLFVTLVIMWLRVDLSMIFDLIPKGQLFNIPSA